MILRHKRPMARLLAAMLACLITTPALAATPPTPTEQVQTLAAPAPLYLVNQQRSITVAPGVTQREVTLLDARGWVRAQVLEADLTNPMISLDLLFPGTITATETVSRAVSRTGAIAAINGDFFDMQGTRAPLGAAVQAGEMLKSGHEGWESAVGVDADGFGRLTSLYVSGTVTLPGSTQPLAGLNHYLVPQNGLGLYTPAWGAASRRGVADGVLVREVFVEDGIVTKINEQISLDPIPANGYVLIGRESSAEALFGLQVGDPVAVTYGPSEAFRFAVGGSPVLVRDGQIQPVEDVGAHPRTAIGFSGDGSRIFMVFVEGRQSHSRGMTPLELARFMHHLGADNALNLDGGGSSVMVARLPGAIAPSLMGSPAGAERAVANAIGLYVQPGSGVPTGIRLESSGTLRTFPGLTRQLSAFPYDETYGRATSGPITWSVSGETESMISPSGLLRAGTSGPATVTASTGGISSSLQVEILGELARLETVSARLELQPGASATFQVIGYDAQGRSAPIDAIDLAIPAVSSLSITRSGSSFRVTATEAGPAVVSVAHGGVQTYLPVAVGFQATVVSSFEQPSAWAASSSNAGAASASLSFAEGVSGQAAALSYDFTLGGGTRAAYLTAAPGDLALPGRPTVLGVSVKGDGSGTWLRAQLRDAGGNLHTINLADRVDWTDWRYIEAVIPAVVQYPVSLWRIYPVETDSAKQYAGTLLFDDLTVKGAPEVAVPAQPVKPDPLIRPGSTWEADRLKLAVLGSADLAAPEGVAVAIHPGLIRKGAAHSFDQDGVRIITLDAGTGSFRTAGYQQLIDLRRLLDEAAADEAVTQVILAAARPTAGLTDRMEAGLIERWLAEFQDTSGKHAAYLAMGNTDRSVRRVEGVVHLSVDGASMATVGLGVGEQWLLAEFGTGQPKQFSLNAPASMKVGARVQIAPAGSDKSQWRSDGSIIIGAAHEIRMMEHLGIFTAAFNPATGELRALKPGKATIYLQVAGTITEATIAVEP